MNRPKKILLFFFGLFLLAVGYAYWMMPEQKRVALELRPAPVAKVEGKVVQIKKNRLRVDLLNKEPTRYKGASRDIFNYYVPKKKPVSLPKPTPEPIVKKTVEPKPTPTPVVNQVVRRQLARFTFLGFLIKDELRTIFLSRGENLFLVQEGDRFGDDDQFTAVSISPEKLIVSQSGETRTIDILLVEKEPLTPSAQQGESAIKAPVRAQNPAPVRPKSSPASNPRWKRPAGSGVR